ncbi:MAG: aminotransferase class I/II-fold pyridoxal phosphate-dependent enzyme [Caldicoprobacterales bacterium]|jgi:lysine decarboxylase|nr:aminotransferase class I/II-fold pyridoxal phosphate-dependent enzyme [Clostridiales bacterium]
MNTPLVSALMKYISNQPIPFHMPGHKGGRLFPSFPSYLQMDLTELPGLDNLQAPEGPILEAQTLAARAFRSDACFFLVNGSTSGIHVMMMSAFRPGDKVIIPRNCHKAVWGGMILSGVHPIYVQPEYDEDKCLPTHVSPEALERVIDENPNAAGMVLTNPDYYGLCPRLSEIRNILDRYNMKMLVDEAHGAHLIFHPDLPPSAGQCGADLWVQSAHKTLPALTQSAYLHVGTQERGSGTALSARTAQVHRLMQSTSPSYLLMASLDWARAYMETRGREDLSLLLEHLFWTRKELGKLGIDTMENYSRPELFGIDKTRLVLDVSMHGYTGFEAEEALRKAGLQVEMSDFNRLLLICSVADRKEDFLKLTEACRNLFQNKGNAGKMSRKLTISREIPRQMLSPKEAFEKEKEFIPLKEAGGRICGEPIGTYPPGIPRFLPGELIDAHGLNELLENQAWGAHLFGVHAGNLVSIIK